MKLLICSRNWLLALLASMLLGAAPAGAGEAVSEQAVRAVLLFNFIKFTEWPTPVINDHKLLICVDSKDPLQVAAIETLGARQVRDFSLKVSRFDNQVDCDIVYVETRQRWKTISASRGSGNALTVGSYPGFIADGGIIEISLQEDGARFDINHLEAKRAQLRIYPQLLRLARRVVE
jgi:hypothetical protein